MTDAEIIEMAAQSGFEIRNGSIRVKHSNGSWVAVDFKLKHFAGLVEKREREKCAIQIIQDINTPDFLASQEARAGWNVAKQMILEAIQDKTDRANQKCKGQSHE